MVSGLDIFSGIVFAFFGTIVVVNECSATADRFCTERNSDSVHASRSARHVGVLDEFLTLLVFSSGSLVSFVGYVVVWLILGY